MDPLPEIDLPNWLTYPPEYRHLIDIDLVSFDPWYLLNSKLSRWRQKGLAERFPGRQLFAFAARLDNDDIACWEQGLGAGVIILHDFGSGGNANPRTFATFWDWFRQAIEDMIEKES
jgi:hypothetical protein